MARIAPGTYRIINLKAGTALTVSAGGEGYVFCWQRHGGKVQQWRVHPFGDRYRFENCGTGQWLSVPNPERANDVYAGRHPATWDLDQGELDHDSYMIRFREYDRVLGLDGWGAERNGNNAHMSLDTKWMPHRSWKFELLGHEPRAEDQKLHKQIAERDQRLAEKDLGLIRKGEELAKMVERIAIIERENGIRGLDEERRPRRDMPAPGDDTSESSRLDHAESIRDKEDSENLSALREALDRAKDTIRDRDITILTLENQLRLHERADRETKEVERLGARIAGLETQLEAVGPAGRNAA